MTHNKDTFQIMTFFVSHGSHFCVNVVSLFVLGTGKLCGSLVRQTFFSPCKVGCVKSNVMLLLVAL